MRIMSRALVARITTKRFTRVLTRMTLIGVACMIGTVTIGCGSHNDSGPDVMTKKFPGSGAANGGTTPAPATK